ncbi:diaminopimelate epimerase [Clostridia bacterium]|nr:diaminopimelate epimerase [Clostridia bacterium]
MEFSKYQALGNDYIVIDPSKNAVRLSAENIRAICHRNFGVGSDGILYGPFFDDNGGISLKIYNPDGGEAEKSGNGIRIFSKYLHDKKYIKDSGAFELDTLGGRVTVNILDENANLIEVNMGKVTFTSEKNAALKVGENTYNVTCVSIGNPHCVIVFDEISKKLADTLGGAIETHEMFPNRVNVQFMKILDDRTIQIEIWERGAGYTLASGSSSCAAAAAAHALGHVGRDITVRMAGGEIYVKITDDGIIMKGNVFAVYDGQFNAELVNLLK